MLKESKINKINTNINASISMSKTRPFLLYNIPSGYAVVYVNNGILATMAKPCIDAGDSSGENCRIQVVSGMKM
jgi:hypothetical protein